MENGLKLWKNQRDLLIPCFQWVIGIRFVLPNTNPAKIFAEWKGEQAVGIGSSDWIHRLLSFYVNERDISAFLLLLDENIKFL